MGVFTKQGCGKYVKLFSDFDLRALSRGLPVKKQAVDCEITLKKLLTILDENAVNEIVVYKDGQPFKELKQQQLSQIALSYPVYARLCDVLA